MVLHSRSMKSRSFHLESENIRGELLILKCRSSNSLSCEIEVYPRSTRKSVFLVPLSFLVVVGATFVTWWISDVQSTSSTWLFASCLLGLIILWIKYNYFDVIKESVTVVKNIGIQIKTTYKSGKQALKFVDHKSVADIIINEAITMHKVIFYVAILTRNSENTKKDLKLVPLFTVGRPKAYLSFYKRYHL
ncbi:phosphatidylinositol N-acetylglucosaminyltransferase subunit H-like isoform X2 [Actinia tenebrosa]|uniref:Phosphatidylinositol N-acetylglucosaminyltransferase subunit H-like isoform X2 n=1 Tax=Actinia tenebrosa TaxID=6105 RepID=A0A6P8HR03_ACTTE|nr:phosphatidylinositol N-acetylglucosaminyltransferase subunit H-like isoform X2 [Actinia tenebrosa]